MKNMKKLSILLMGCLVSLAMMAQDIYVHHIDVESDPYTCYSVEPYTLASTINNPPRVFIYEINTLGNPVEIYSAEGSEPKTYNVSPLVGKHTYVVKAYSSSQILPGTVPVPTAVDTYYVNVKYHIEKHEITLNLDPYFHSADYQLYSTAGQPDPNNPGKTFCADDLAFKYEIPGETDPTIIAGDPTLVNDVVTMGPGYHDYEVYLLTREGEIVWCDLFSILVRETPCSSVVYKKWNDFMFVDNGAGGGDGAYVSYQWFRDGEEIEGATDQWYRTSLPQFEDDLPCSQCQYYVRIKTNEGTTIYSCPEYFENLPASTLQNSHGEVGAPHRKQLQNGQLIIEHGGHQYNAQGAKIQ